MAHADNAGGSSPSDQALENTHEKFHDPMRKERF
jgi:hypothetical protein